jgi:hypothetical protein
VRRILPPGVLCSAQTSAAAFIHGDCELGGSIGVPVQLARSCAPFVRRAFRRLFHSCRAACACKVRACSRAAVAACADCSASGPASAAAIAALVAGGDRSRRS